MNDVRQYMNEQKVCVVIPTYNNAATIADILRRTLAITDYVIVVIDGCTDNTRELVTDFDVHVVDYAKKMIRRDKLSRIDLNDVEPLVVAELKYEEECFN